MSAAMAETADKSEAVDRYLLDELGKAIDRMKQAQGCLSGQLLHLHSDFRDLKDMVEKNKAPKLATDQSRRRATLYHLNNLLTEWQMILQKRGTYAPESLYASYKLDKSLKNIRKELKRGEESTSKNTAETGRREEEDTTTEQSFPTNLETYRWSSRYRTEAVHGFDDKTRFMKRLLVNKKSQDEFRAIAIVGIPGVGKTALCQVMFNKDEVKEHYPLRLWVCLSRQPTDDDSRKEALKRILICLGVDTEVIDHLAPKKTKENHEVCEERRDHEVLRRLIIALRVQLTGKRYLLILDNASHDKKFFENLSSKQESDDHNNNERLADALPKGEGSMVIVTTRSEGLAKKMVGDKNVHHLPLLKKEEVCWEIFKDVYTKGGKTSFPAKYEEMKDLVIKNCGGLPLTATMMAEITRQRDAAEKSRSAKKGAQDHHEDGPQLSRRHTL